MQRSWDAPDNPGTSPMRRDVPWRWSRPPLSQPWRSTRILAQRGPSWAFLESVSFVPFVPFAPVAWTVDHPVPRWPCLKPPNPAQVLLIGIPQSPTISNPYLC
ncbi:uncharacterized protein BJX67DRAFT_360405 [Aspergillus lucknowensis]|uniref:Uncharacterized protein n=1 Tax=Aspergillus lucknowensis TaxID=176173 RepID=A0ABR4LK39_9EURO